MIMVLLAGAVLEGNPPAAVLHSAESTGVISAARTSFYCQTPFVGTSINASTGYGSELADDIPHYLDGMGFNEITLWIAEWQISDPQDWIDPDGVRIRIYDDVCPPLLDPVQLFDVAWSEITTTLTYSGGPWVIYEAVIPLPEAVTITTATSIGIQVINSWGDGFPWVGVMALYTEDSYGCPAFLSDPTHGAPRWTRIDQQTGTQFDIAYCLDMQTVGIPPEETPVRATSWGRVKGYYR